MWTMWTSTLMLGVLILVAVVTARPSSLSNELFDKAFDQFLYDNSYSGGAVAAMKDDRLIHARGYGRNHQGHEVTAHTHFPVSSIAKSLTAVAVMKLVQEGELSTEDKVFGDEGILWDYEPWSPKTVDDRLYMITVDHLLKHGAGWDVSKPPLYDPVLNDVYLQRGHKVTNIAKEMDMEAPLSSYDLITYMMSQPLTFTPGTQTAYSNIGYLILGRVIEEISGLEYRDYVKKVILDPCGMWSTRLEMPDSFEQFNPFGDDDPPIYAFLDPVSIDSTLGWYSNVYDLTRFARCALDKNTILDNRHLEKLLSPLSSAPIQHDDTWHCAGFRTNTRGALWQDADLHAYDLILFHNLDPDRKEKSGMPDTWVVLLSDKNINHIRHFTRELMESLDFSSQVDELSDEGETYASKDNLFLYDLSELHTHDMWEPRLQSHAPGYCVKYQLDEHHLTAYVQAIQDENFDLEWFTAYSIYGHTYFLLVSRRVDQPDRTRYDYIFKHGLTHRTLLKKKLEMEQMGYNLTQLHSYHSRSHEEEPTAFAAIFRPDAFSLDMQMKYGTGHLPEPYEKLVQMYYEKKFYPISQTVVYDEEEEEELFSFIFIKNLSDKERTDFKHYYGLTLRRLSSLVMSNVGANMKLSYLTSYDVDGKFKFSAIFTNATRPRGLLEIDQSKDRATEITISNLVDGLVPRYIVPYVSDDKQIKFAIYYEETQFYAP